MDKRWEKSGAGLALLVIEGVGAGSIFLTSNGWKWDVALLISPGLERSFLNGLSESKEKAMKEVEDILSNVDPL